MRLIEVGRSGTVRLMPTPTSSSPCLTMAPILPFSANQPAASRFEREALAVGLLRIARRVEQRRRLLGIEGGLEGVRREELLVGREDRARARPRIAVVDRLGDQVAVDGEEHRLAHLALGEDRIAHVDLQGGRPHGFLVALGRGDELAGRGQPLDVGRRHGIEHADMDVARLHRRGAAGRIAHVADDQPVEVGLVLAPVGVVLDVLEMAAAHPFLELPRARADRRVVGRVGDGIAAGIDVLGHDVVHVAAEQRGEEELRHRLAEAHHDGVGVGRGNAREVGEGGGRGVLLPDLVDRIDDVVDGHVLAVVELHALADLDGVGLEVGGGLPRLGQLALRTSPSIRRLPSRSNSLDEEKVGEEPPPAGT